MRRHSNMLNLPQSPAHNPKFDIQLSNSLGSSQTLFVYLFCGPSPSLILSQVPLI